MDWREHIWLDAERMHGTPCLRGTRIPVYVILDNLAAGETAETILDQFPALRPEHIPAAPPLFLRRGFLSFQSPLDNGVSPQITDLRLLSPE